jgi:sulfur carrier protein ThiS
MDQTIIVCVVPHAILRKLVESEDPIDLSLPAGSNVADVCEALGFPEMELVYSLNGQIAAERDVLKDGDRLDIIPAISGG